MATSASERLRALPERQRYENGGYPGLVRDTLEDALPLIADVIEAAERMDAAIETNSEEGTPDWFLAPLTALQEHLEN